MTMQWSRRSVIGAALIAAIPAASVASAAEDKAAGQDKSAGSAKGKLTDESLGTLLKAMGFDAKVQEKRYDFAFKATIEKEEWELSMSTVLSQDGASIWVMAWLDELPTSASDVPRTALLRLLSDNDKMGKGKFFAWIASNRRFVLQRVIPNEAVTSEKFRAVLDDLGQTVVGMHPHWSVSNWTAPATEEPAQTAKTGASVKGSNPTPSTKTAGAQPTTTPGKGINTATSESKAGGAQKR